MSFSDILKQLKDLSLDLDDDIFVGIQNSLRFQIKEIYRIGAGFPVESNDVGSWTINEGITWTTREKWFRRGNLKVGSKYTKTFQCNKNDQFQGFQLRFTTLMENPFMTRLDLDPTAGAYTIEGMFADLIQHLQDAMNFTYSMTPPPDNNWGGLQSNGSWNGMMGQLERGQVDVGKVPSSGISL